MTFLDCMEPCKAACDQDLFFSDACENCMAEKNCSEPENHMRKCTKNNCHDDCQVNLLAFLAFLYSDNRLELQDLSERILRRLSKTYKRAEDGLRERKMRESLQL